jgi:hypothetical protein
MRWDKLTDKNKYVRWLRSIQLLKTWQLVILLLLFTILSATLLRLNNLGMVERRSVVLQADESGDKEALKKSVIDLQRYVARHMNTSLGNGFFLTKSYERDRDAVLAAANQNSNPNSSVYQQASIDCRSRFQGGRESFRNDYVQCVVERVSALSPQASGEAGLNLPKADAYKISFSSPIWTPDLAGLSVAVCAFITVVIFGRLLLVALLRFLIRRHYQSI